jgi:hypothetical protein
VTDAKPTASIVDPAAGATVTAGDVVYPLVTASDDLAIKSVVLTVDGLASSPAGTAPYAFSWTPATSQVGKTVVLRAKVTDSSGQVAYSAPLSVTVVAPVVASPTPSPTSSSPSPSGSASGSASPSATGSATPSATATAPPATAEAPAPVNPLSTATKAALTLGKATLKKAKGTATLAVKVNQAGTVKITVKPTAKQLKLLKKKGKVKVKVKVTFTAASGKVSKTKTLTLKYTKKKK